MPLGPDLCVILVRMDHHRAGEILDRRRERPLGDDADLVFVELLGARDPVDILLA